MRVSVVLSLLPLGGLANPLRRSSPAPVIEARDGHGIPGQYIVGMKHSVAAFATTDKSGISSVVTSALKTISATANYTYGNHFHGFAAKLTPAELETLQNDPNVRL